MPPVALIVVGAALAVSAGPVAVGIFGSIALFQTMVGMGLSLVMGGISKALKGGTPKSNYSRTSTLRQAVYDGRVIYGQARIGGVLTYLETSGANNTYLHLVYTLCSHELASIDTMYFESEAVYLDGSGNAIGNYSGLVHVEKNLGTYEQQAFAGLIGSSTLWTVNHRQRGRASVYVRLKWDQNKFPSGVPNISFDVTGRPVRGLRGSGIVYSNNSALCLADYLLDSDFGLHAQRKMTGATLSQSGLNVFDLAHVSDDDYAAAAFSIIGSAPNSWLMFDFGSANLKEISEVRLYADGTADGVMRLQYSDDNATWTSAITNLRPVLGRIGVANKYRVPLCGQHRYWRLLVDVAATVGLITEVELMEPAIDISGLTAAATTCDELVNLKAGGTEKRYATDGAFDLTENPVDVVTALAGAMAGFCTYVGGQFALYPGTWRAPDASLSFSEADLAGPLKVMTRRSKRDVYNSVRGTFISPADSWQATNFPVVSDLTRLGEDLGERLYLDAQLPFTISSPRAQRISRIALNRSRKQISVQARFKLTAYRFQPCDVIRVTNARFGWTNKNFEVESVQFAAESGTDEEGPILVVDATLRETDSTIYDWTPATDELPQSGVLPAAFPTRGPCAAPTNLVLTPTDIVRNADGLRSNVIIVSWTAPDDQYVQSGGHITVLYKQHVAVPWTVFGMVEGDQTSAVIPAMFDATSYDVKIYATNIYGVKSAEVSGTTTTGSTPTTIDGLSDGTKFVKQPQGSFPSVGAGAMGGPSAATTIDASINYGDTISGSSPLPAGVNANYIYARWQGYLIPTVSGLFTIGVNSDDGANLYVGNVPLVSNLAAGQGQAGNLVYTQSGTINLQAGTYYPIVVEWQQGMGAKGIQLLWTPPGGAVQLIGYANLSTTWVAVTGNLRGTWWNGTAGVWYPTGAHYIDFGGIHPNKNLDNINDGGTYGKVFLGRVNAGRPIIDFSEPIHANKNLDNISDGGTYGKVILGRLSGGRPLIDFGEPIHANKNLDNIGDGGSRFAAAEPGADRTAGKSIDVLADGSTYVRSTAASLSYRPRTNPLTATGGTINIAAFSMAIVGRPDVSLSSGAISGLDYNRLYYVFYDDPTLAGGAVAYQAATTKETTLGAAGRFFIGSISTPRSTAPDTGGNGDGGSAAQYGMVTYLYFSTLVTQAQSGSGAVTNAANGNDADPTTYAAFTIGGNSAASYMVFHYASPASLSRKPISLTLKMRSAVPVNNLTGSYQNDAFLRYSLHGLNGPFINVFSLNGSQTRPLTLDIVSLPLDCNPGNVMIEVGVSNSAGGNPNVELDLYECWIEAVE